MLKFIPILAVLMVAFVLVNQFIIPALGCGSTIGEGLALLSLPVLFYLVFKSIRNILNYKR